MLLQTLWRRTKILSGRLPFDRMLPPSCQYCAIFPQHWRQQKSEQ